jgi:predicted metal-binding membrane protein
LTTARYPLPRERNAILATLLLLAAAAWAVLLWQSRSTDDLSMSASAVVFLAIWIVMMVAMMFPTAAPMILTYRRVEAGRSSGGGLGATWLFVGVYLLLWTLFGALAFALATAASSLMESQPLLADSAARIGGLAIVLAGVYQLTPLKRTCLSRCRSPMDFVLGSWRDGLTGAVRMGLEHGAYCLGCCWLLFVILFPLGLMNIAAMALITLAIFAEKSLPIGPRVSVVTAAVLVVYGAFVLVVPEALPMMSPTSHM